VEAAVSIIHGFIDDDREGVGPRIHLVAGPRLQALNRRTETAFNWRSEDSEHRSIGFFAISVFYSEIARFLNFDWNRKVTSCTSAGGHEEVSFIICRFKAWTYELNPYFL
jgi:hypothetical protein